MELGLVSATFKDRPYTEVISIACNAGLSCIEWSENHHVPATDINKAKEIAEYSSQNGIKVLGYGSYFKLGCNMDIMPSLNNAKAMGAKFVRIWGGTKEPSQIDDSERLALLEEIKSVCKLAKEKGLEIVFEWHRKTITQELDYALSFISDENCSNLKCLWQTNPDISESQRYKEISELVSKDILTYVHVFHWDDMGKRRPFNEGIEEWEKLLAVSKNSCEAYMLEFVLNNTEEQFYEDAKFLKKLCRGEI